MRQRRIATLATLALAALAAPATAVEYLYIGVQPVKLPFMQKSLMPPNPVIGTVNNARGFELRVTGPAGTMYPNFGGVATANFTVVVPDPAPPRTTVTWSVPVAGPAFAGVDNLRYGRSVNHPGLFPEMRVQRKYLDATYTPVGSPAFVAPEVPLTSHRSRLLIPSPLREAPSYEFTNEDTSEFELQDLIIYITEDPIPEPYFVADPSSLAVGASLAGQVGTPFQLTAPTTLAPNQSFNAPLGSYTSPDLVVTVYHTAAFEDSDAVAFLESFQVIPTPGTAAIAILGTLAVGIRRRS